MIRYGVAGAAYAIALLGIGLSGGQRLTEQFRIDLGSAPPNLRTERYLGIGRALRAECPTCSLLTSEIGGLGFGFGGRIHDAMGLVDPSAVPYHPLGVPESRHHWFVGAIPPLYVRRHSPDLVVSMPTFSAALRRSGELASYHRYECPIGRRGTIRYRIYGDTVIEIYSRTELTTSVLESMNCRAAPAQR